MLIINADDFGRSRQATDRTLSCYKQGTITSTSAMVFMEDSQRAAELAKEYSIDTGLHLNFTQGFTQCNHNSQFRDYHSRIVGYLTRKKYNFLFYNPVLQKQFDYVFHVQLEEFEHLFGMFPSHIDGHHHMHLCANMLFGAIIPNGHKVRRNLSFVQGEKSLPNRMYRAAIDNWLTRRYSTTDYLFSLPERIKTGRLEYALDLAKTSIVELETHPELTEEFEWLTGSKCIRAFSSLQRGTYTQVER